MFPSDRMLQYEVTAACRDSLARGAARRRAVATPEQWHAWRELAHAAFRGPYPTWMFDRPKTLNARLVSAHEFDGYRIENVLFESIPGWEVNATVYLPKPRGVYPGVVCPTGHSTKTERCYQLSAQLIARNGYVVVSFDPPGMSGELNPLNDHFTNGLIGFLTGVWSDTHFVIDALRCLDYLETRPDVDQRAGFGMTGVSGGGKTSLNTAILDERVACVAPVCCLSEHELIHLQDLYTSCPEQFGHGYIAAGLDYADYVSLVAPRPCLIVAGKGDEVFDHRAVVRIHEEAKRIYAAAGCPDHCGLLIDERSGHDYSLAMAHEVVRWMNRFIKKTGEAPLPLTEDQIQVQPREKLLCHPGNRANMFTVNRDEGARLKVERGARPAAMGTVEHLRRVAGEILGVSAGLTPLRVEPRSAPKKSWHTWVEELDVQPAEHVHLPAVMFSHALDRSPRPALLWIDDEGKWAALRQGGFLFSVIHPFEAQPAAEPVRLLSLEVSGLASLSPESVPYDLAQWNDVERILTYLSIANARPIMGLRVRDALCALAYLRGRPDVDPERLIVGGRGIGAIVALHAALLAGDVKEALCLDMLSHFGALTEQFPFNWRHSIIIPQILNHYDLPEVAAAMAGTRVIVVNPVDAQKKPLAQTEAEALYAAAIRHGAVVRCGVDGGAAVLKSIEELLRPAGVSS